MRSRQRLVTFGIVWFLVGLVPSASLVVLQDAGHPMAEHRLYLPGIGFFLAIAAGAEYIIRGSRVGDTSRRAALAMWAAVIVILAGASVARERVWADPVTLWRDAASKAPEVFTAQYGLAEAYRASSDCANAIPAYRRAQAIRPNVSAPYVGRAWCLLEQGEREQAREQLQLAVEHAPRDVKARVALAVVEATVFRDRARAADLCQSVMAFAPADPEAADCFRRSVDKVAP
jgi:tetratricopeptide (TPR) repeat protein